MNLRAIANKLTKTVNPNITVTWALNTGWVTQDDGSRVASYEKTQIEAQVQSASTESLRLVEKLNMQGVFREVYIYEKVQAIVRAFGKGSDFLLFPIAYDGEPDKWKVVQVLEMWPDWVKVLVQLQDDE